MTGRKKKSNFRKIWYSPPLKCRHCAIHSGGSSISLKLGREFPAHAQQ